MIFNKFDLWAFNTTIESTKCEASQTATFRKTLDVTADFKIEGPIEGVQFHDSQSLKQFFTFDWDLC